jgi:hypothetical protein
MDPEDIFNAEGEWITDEADFLIAEIREHGITPERQARVQEIRGRMQQWKRELIKLEGGYYQN